jgi:hypothetical protein
MDQSKLMALLASKKQAMKKVAKTVKPQTGKNRVRILPGWRKGEEFVWFHDFGQHFVKNAADELQAVYLCTSATYEKPCEVCAALSVASKGVTDDETLEVLGQARANKSILVNALMLDSTEPNTPVILELKSGVFGEILEIIEEYEGKPLDPELGQEIIITREGTGKLTKYKAMIGPKVYKVPPAALTQLHDLDAYVKQESDENKRKAIAAVNSVAGFLPAPSGSDVPKTTASRLAAPAKAPAATEFEDVPDFDEKPAAAKTAAPAARADVALDSELDDLLNDI